MDERSVKRLGVIILTAVALILVFKSIGLKMATRVGQERQKTLSARQVNTPPAPPAEPVPAAAPEPESAPVVDTTAESAPAASAPAPAPAPGQDSGGAADAAPGQGAVPNSPAGN